MSKEVLTTLLTERVIDVINTLEGYKLYVVHFSGVSIKDSSVAVLKFNLSLYNSCENIFERAAIEIDIPDDISDHFKEQYAQSSNRVYYRQHIDSDGSIVINDLIKTIFNLFNVKSFCRICLNENIDPAKEHNAYDDSIYNTDIIKPTLSGKYKTNIRMIAPIPKISQAKNAYIYSNIYISFDVSRLKRTDNISDRLYFYGNDDKKLIRNFQSVFEKAKKNKESIKIPEILAFDICTKSTNMSIQNVIYNNGDSLSLNMLPEESLLLKAITECLTSDDYVKFIDTPYCTRYLCIKDLYKNFSIKQCDNNIQLVSKNNEKNFFGMTEEFIDRISGMMKTQEEKDFIEELQLLVIINRI